MHLSRITLIGVIRAFVSGAGWSGAIIVLPIVV